jgi:hypothetical protein
MKTLIIRSLLFCVVFVGMVSAEELSTNPLRYRTYTAGQSLWMWDHSGILEYRYDTKVLKNLSLSDSAGSDTVLDVVDNSDVLWMVVRSGLLQVDMNTSTVERIPGGPADFSESKVTADQDFAWVARKDALWKFDKLSREWFSFPVANKAATANGIIGVYTDGLKVYCITTSTVEQFSIADEKWSAYPFKNFSFSPEAEFYPEKLSLIVVEKSKIYRYVMAQLSWDVTTAPSDIIDFYPSDDKMYYLTANGVFLYTASTSVVMPFEINNNSKKFKGLSVLNDSTIMLSGDEKTLVEYITPSRSVENLIYPPQLTGRYPIKMIKGDVLLYSDAITIYNWSTQTWELYRVPVAGAGNSAVTWDDNGLKARYAPGFTSVLKGSVTQRFQLQDAGWNRYDTVSKIWHSTVANPDSGVHLFKYSPDRWGEDLYSDLTLHTTLSGNRYADITFQKQAGSLPQKGIFYRGEADDILESARLGTNTMTIPLSQTVPSVQFEGAGAIVHSKEGLADRDRKIVRAQAGAGLITSKTMYTTLTYNKENHYKVGSFADSAHLMVIPGSLSINVDGEDIDSSQYTFVPLTGDLSFQYRDLLDPSSVIVATYKVETIPDSGIDKIEFVPKNHFGQLDFVSATVSPVDWMSVAGTYTTLKSTSLDTRRNIGTIMAPFEFRESDKNLMLKLTPELSYETSNQAKAGGLGLQGRIGDWAFGKATSLLLNYNAVDKGYSTTDTISHGYGKTMNDLNFTLEHDVLTEIPLVYTETDRQSAFGSQHFRLASAGAHFQNIPFLDLQVSQNNIDVNNKKDTSSADTTGDTLALNTTKSKVKLRLYELSSPVMQSLTHFHKFGYDFSYTHFVSKKESPDSLGWTQLELPGKGDIFQGSATLCPLSSINITGQTTYKKNIQDSQIDSLHTFGLTSMELNPTLTIQTIDAPPGIDFNAYYSADYSGGSLTDTTGITHYDSTGTVAIQRNFFVITKPGEWTKYLSWMSPRFGLSQNLTCRFDTTNTTLSEILFGTSGKRGSSFSRLYGVYLYPTSDIVLRQENTFTTSDSVTNYYMFNDAKWWFGANHLWQTRWEYNAIDNGPHSHTKLHKMFSMFDATWFSWLRTNEKLTADYTIKDTSIISAPDTNGVTTLIDSSRTQFDFGPEVSVSFNVQHRGIIKTFLNNQTVSLQWEKINGRLQQGAVFSYSNYFNLIFKPNLSLESNHTISWTKGFTTYNGYLTLGLLF